MAARAETQAPERPALTFEHAIAERDRWDRAVQLWRRRFRGAWEQAGRPVPERTWRTDDPDTLALRWAHAGAGGNVRVITDLMHYHACGARRDTWQEVAELLCPGHEWEERRELGDEVGLVCTRCGAAEVA